MYILGNITKNDDKKNSVSKGLINANIVIDIVIQELCTILLQIMLQSN